MECYNSESDCLFPVFFRGDSLYTNHPKPSTRCNTIAAITIFTQISTGSFFYKYRRFCFGFLLWIIVENSQIKRGCLTATSQLKLNRNYKKLFFLVIFHMLIINFHYLFNIVVCKFFIVDSSDQFRIVGKIF